MTLSQLLLSLVFIYLAAKVGAELAQRLGQPPVLGELVGGVAIGTSGLHLVAPHAEMLHLLAELGVLVLLFEVGLETKLRDLKRAGPEALAVALVGVAAPFALGAAVTAGFGHPPLTSVLVGAALGATSIGIVARVLADRQVLATALGSIILGAAVIDDVLGVSLLGVISHVAETGAASPGAIALTAATSIAFIGGTLLLGRRIARTLMRGVAFLRTRGILLVTFTAFAFWLAWLAEALGSSALIGAFAAGLLLEDTEQKHELEHHIHPVSDLFAPIFFVTVGAALDLSRLNPFAPGGLATLGFTLALTAVAIAGKLAAGWGAWRGRADRLAVGIGMLARGEVGLVFAGVGESAGILSPSLYAALVATMAITTLVAPPWLDRRLAGHPTPD